MSGGTSLSASPILYLNSSLSFQNHKYFLIEPRAGTEQKVQNSALDAVVRSDQDLGGLRVRDPLLGQGRFEARF